VIVCVVSTSSCLLIQKSFVFCEIIFYTYGFFTYFPLKKTRKILGYIYVFRENPVLESLYFKNISKKISGGGVGVRKRKVFFEKFEGIFVSPVRIPFWSPMF
jgi:hypothetical protein